MFTFVESSVFARIIHFLRYEPNEFWMLTLYSKAKHDDVPAHVLKQLLEAFRNG